MSFDVEECTGISYDYENFVKVYVPRIKLQEELLSAVLNKKLIWVDGPGGSGKTTLVSWLIRELMENTDKYRILLIPVRIKPRSVYNAFSAIELLVKCGVEEYLGGNEIGRFFDSARRGLDYLSKFLETVSIVFIVPLKPVLGPITVASSMLYFLGILYNKAYKYSRVKSEEDFLKKISDELGKEIGKRFKDFKYTEALLIVDDLGDLPDDTSRKNLLKVLTYLAKEVQLKVLVVRRRFEIKRPIGKRLLGVLRVEEEDLLQEYYKVEVPGLSRGELDILKRIVKTLPLKSMRKFKFKKSEEDEIAEELFNRTGGLPRILCIAMYNYLRETLRLKDWDLLTLDRVRRYVKSDAKEILDSYLHHIASDYGGVFNEKFYKLMKLASCMPSFTKDELMEITEYDEDEVKTFLEWGGLKRSDKLYHFNDKWYWLKHAVYETVLSNEEKRRIHEKILEYFKSGEKTFRKYQMTVYQAEELLELVINEEEREELARLIVERAMVLAYLAYYEGIPFATVYYGLKAYNYAEELKMWIKALVAAEAILHYAGAIQLSEEIAESIKDELREIFEKAKEVNEEDARYYYAEVLSIWAFYALNTLRDGEEAESAVNEGLSVIDGRDSKLISDELKWYHAYSRLLTIQADIAMSRLDYDSAMGILEEMRELLDKYRDRIVKRWSEDAYYHILAAIESRLGKLTLMMADSEDKLKESLEHFKNSLKNNLKGRRIVDVAGARINIATIMMLLAESPNDFERAVSEEIEEYDLNRCIKLSEETGNRKDEAMAKRLMSISLLANRRDKRAEKLAREALGIVKGNPDEYAKAVCELTLAYILMVSKLDEFRRNESIAELISRLTLSAHNRFDKLRAANRCISSVILGIELHLLGRLDFDELLKDLDKLISMLKEKRDELLAWVLRGVREAIKKEGLNEEVLRAATIKLLVAF